MASEELGVVPIFELEEECACMSAKLWYAGADGVVIAAMSRTSSGKPGGGGGGHAEY